MRGSGLTAADVISFLPISNEMKTLFVGQGEIMAKKHGSAALDDVS